MRIVTEKSQQIFVSWGLILRKIFSFVLKNETHLQEMQ